MHDSNPHLTVETARPHPRRDAALRALTDRPLDVLVVGGGIVGAGVARDAAMRGLRVGLLEQADFASGTSSRSSRLLHGGLRYLAQGRVGLVREAGREKKILHRIAPHLAAPLAFVFPTYKGTDWPLAKLRIGVRLYDLLCGVGAKTHGGRSGGLCAADTMQLISGVNAERLTGAVRYYDSFTNDARLVLDTLRSAERHGAMLLNYAQVERPTHKAGKGWTCSVRDVAGGRSFDVQARAVVNAAGPWADRFDHSQLKLRLTKGVHVVVDADRLPVTNAVVVAQGTRILFVIPYGKRLILGTTDTDYHGDPSAVQTDPADVQYILDQVNAAFPDARLRTVDVLADWAGLRPLISDKAAQAGKPSDISRKHVVRLSGDDWMDVAGGKLTTYRHIAQDAMNKLVRRLGIDARPSGTADEPLVSPQDAEGISGLLPMAPSASLVEHFCRNEWAEHLDDVMIRRTSWRYYQDQPDALAEDVAAWMARAKQWDAQRTAEELGRYRAHPGYSPGANVAQRVSA